MPPTKVLWSWCYKTYKWPFHYHTIQKLALQGAASLKIPQQHFKAHKSWAVNFTHHASLATCPRPTLAQNLHTMVLKN